MVTLRTLPTETVDAIVAALNAGDPIRKTARHHGLSDYMVRRIGVQAGIEFHSAPGRPTINIKAPADPRLDGALPDWTTRAACHDVPDVVFYPTSSHPNAARQAKAICAGCPVRTDCLERALDVGEGYGIWGGLTAYERAKLTTNRTTHPHDTTDSQEGTA